MNEYFKKNWLNTLSVTIGIVGIIIAIYAYTRAKKERIPTFYVDSVRTQIIDAKQVATAPIKVIRDDGSEINVDLNAVRFYFWNDGNESIRAENILENIIITLDDPNAEILDYKILKSPRPLTGIQLKKTTLDDRFYVGLEIKFRILEKNDGFSGQIIYAGKPDANLNIFGAIEGYGSIIPKIKQKEENSFPSIILGGLTITGINILILYLMRTGSKYRRIYLAKINNKKGESSTAQNILSFIIGILLGPLLGLGILWFVIEHIIPSFSQLVPKSILF